MSAAHIALFDSTAEVAPRKLVRTVGFVLGGLAALALVAVPGVFVALLFVRPELLLLQ